MCIHDLCVEHLLVEKVDLRICSDDTSDAQYQNTCKLYQKFQNIKLTTLP